MKTEFIVLSPAGVVALLIGGVLAGASLASHFDVGMALFAGLAFAVARENARESFATGSYTRGWLVWHRTGPATEEKASGNVVPFHGPAA